MNFFQVSINISSDETKKSKPKKEKESFFSSSLSFKKFHEVKADSPKSSWLSLHRPILHRRMFHRHRVTFTLSAVRLQTRRSKYSSLLLSINVVAYHVLEYSTISMESEQIYLSIVSRSHVFLKLGERPPLCT